MNSVRARLNVAQIVQQVKENAAITFDFVTLLVVAGYEYSLFFFYGAQNSNIISFLYRMLAAFGLVENSLVFLTSSMLISPLMVSNR